MTRKKLGLRLAVVLSAVAVFMVIGRLVHATPTQALALGLMVGVSILMSAPYVRRVPDDPEGGMD